MATYNTPFRKSYAPAPTMNLSIGGRDRLGVAGGGPRFRDNWKPLSTPEEAGAYHGFGGYGADEEDPRDGWIDPRMDRMDPRNRARMMAQLAATQGQPTPAASATAQSIQQLGAIGQQQYPTSPTNPNGDRGTGGRGMPTAARGGRFVGPVRVHGGEVVRPDGMGGVSVTDPLAAYDENAEIERQMAASNARDSAALAQANAPYERRRQGLRDFQQVAGNEPYSATADPSQMSEILSGRMHPDAASPEVRSSFMERWAGDPRFAARTRADWDRMERESVGPTREQQQSAAAMFAAQQAEREASMTPEERQARSARRAELDQRSFAASAMMNAARQRDAAIRREALVRDAPLETVKGNDAQYSIDDVLFERTRNRRDAAQQGTTPLGAGIGRRMRRDFVDQTEYGLETERIRALNQPMARGDATVDAASITAASRILASPDATDEDRVAARAMLAGRGASSLAGNGSSVGATVPRAILDSTIGGGWENADEQQQDAVAKTLRLNVVPSTEDPAVARTVIGNEGDYQHLSNITSDNWISDSPIELSAYRSSLDRIAKQIEDVARIEDEGARRLAYEQIARKMQEHQFEALDVTQSQPFGGSYDKIDKGKKGLARIVASLASGGRFSPEEIKRVRRIYSGEASGTDEPTGRPALRGPSATARP